MKEEKEEELISAADFEKGGEGAAFGTGWWMEPSSMADMMDVSKRG